MRNRRSDFIVQTWLVVVAALVFLIIMVGGATRLTDSGLSITHWSPIHGVIPPLSESDWNQEFQLYQNIPEYKLQNKGMSLNEFKFIFWWEWAHRLLGRLIGLVYLVPFLIFAFTKRIRGQAILGYLSIGLLIGFQGFIGWWMVSSGLDGNRIDVAPYRLASHLGLAFLLFGILVALLNPVRRALNGHFGFAFWVMLFIYAQVILGALVAGNRAGFVYNDWPTIGGKWLPDAYLVLQPIWHNFFENQQNTQFNHRIWAYILFVLTLISLFIRSKTSKLNVIVLFLLISMQIALGVFVLKIFAQFTPPHMYGVLIGISHQAFAAIVFGYSVYLWRKSLY